MGESSIPQPNEVIGMEETATLMEVTPDRVQVLIEGGLLHPVGGSGEPRFYRGEVIAARELGG